MNVLIWLANQQSRVVRGLDAGAIVTTGTCTGDRAMADFGQLGTLAIMFTAMTSERAGSARWNGQRIIRFNFAGF